MAAFAVATLALVAGPLVPAQLAAASAPRAGQGAVTYHKGPVQHSSAVYAIFWVPRGYAFPSGYTSLVTRYFTDVAHDSYMPSNVYAVPTQYYNGRAAAKKFESYNVALKAVVVDTKPYPKSGCANYTLGDGTKSAVCLTKAQIQKKLKAVIADKHFPTGLGTNYFLFTPQGVASCKTKALATGGCYNPLQYNGYCAYHSHLGSGDNAVIYAHLPYAALQGCSSGQSPNGNPADAVLNNVAHEHNESMSDPLGNAWYDANGREIADKCHLMFGAPRGSTTFGQYNQFINGNPYWLQQIWSNRAGGCVQRNTFPQPNASFNYKPAAPKPGKKVKFTSSAKEPGESRFTFKWTFPDGGTSTAKNPVHVFKGYVFAGAVTLVVCDTHGGQTRIIRTLTVKQARVPGASRAVRACDNATVEELLAIARGHARRSVGPGDVLIADGQPVATLYVLLEGALRIEKGGMPIAVVTEAGSCVGEMSLLLGIPATADVVVTEPSVLAVIDDAAQMLEGEAGLPVALARLLATRLHVMTGYLADIKNQYADHEGGLGMVDAVLGSLMRGSGARSELGSERDPDPEY